ncbi:MAG: misacylated tRNA(Ala) deacylase [Desulfonauticus sp.]|nr:misacylated tRNA(Ala) deacylase [Desulfonauticus sp.]
MKNYNPKMHTAEHILNQTMDRMFQCGRSFRAHIEKKKSKCDYKFSRMLTEKEIEEVEKQVNLIISKDLPVKTYFLDLEEARKQVDTSKLPSTAKDKIRIVKIGDYDQAACIGEHVGSTREIGKFKISSVSFDAGILRIRFKLEEE